ncbi:MAG: Hsp20/alpha crystallin family protein [Chlorobiota bacterium]
MLVQRRTPMTDFERFFAPVGNIAHEEREVTTKPRVRVSEVEDTLNFVVELPGVDKSTMKLVVNDENVMTLSASRTIAENEDERLMIDELSSADYKRSFIIPTKFETEKIDANFKNGMLMISIPKKETLKPKTINIK